MKKVYHSSGCEKSLFVVHCPRMVVFLRILPFAEIVLAVLLIVGVLLQERSAGIGGALGGGDGSITYHKRRGFERFLFGFTIVVGILFALGALFQVIFG